jgi:hypothetical protein
MAGQRCITLRGSRLVGARVCLFDSPPSDPEVPVFARGVWDICRKRRYPLPHDCRVLGGGGEIVAEIPCEFVSCVYNRDYQSDPEKLFASGDLALQNMWARGPAPPPYQEDTHFVLRFLAEVFEASPGSWCSTGFFNTLNLSFPSVLLDPAWRNDPDISFSVALNPPVVVGCPDWLRLDFGLYRVSFNAAPFESAVDKESFYLNDVIFSFLCNPVGFNYADYLSLPSFGGFGVRGFDFTAGLSVNFRLVVRRGGEALKVCWPEEILNNSEYLAVVDPLSGLVVGPPIKIP